MMELKNLLIAIGVINIGILGICATKDPEILKTLVNDGVYLGESCKDNFNCENYELCLEGRCVNVCFNITCGINEGCFVQHHSAKCECLESYLRNDAGECELACHDDSECKRNQRCLHEEGIYKCKCKSGFSYNSYMKMCQWECKHDSDCSTEGKCIKNQCVDFCPNTKCPYTRPICLIQNYDEKCFPLNDKWIQSWRY